MTDTIAMMLATLSDDDLRAWRGCWADCRAPEEHKARALRLRRGRR